MMLWIIKMNILIPIWINCLRIYYHSFIQITTFCTNTFNFDCLIIGLFIIICLTENRRVCCWDSEHGAGTLLLVSACPWWVAMYYAKWYVMILCGVECYTKFCYAIGCDALLYVIWCYLDYVWSDKMWYHYNIM